MDLNVSAPVDGLALSLAAVFTPILEIQVLQMEHRESVLRPGCLEDSLVLVFPRPGEEDGGVQTAGGLAAQTQS